jgi:molybdate transport system permease protein
MTADAVFPVVLSLRVASLALAIVAPVGLALALVQARARYRLRHVVDACILLPLVLPPSVVGFFLLLVFGRRGPVGGLLYRAFGASITFTPAAAVIASAVVALPILVKTAQPAFESVPVDLESVARTLGLSPASVLLRVTLPSAWRGVLAAIVLGFARALGEFGATLMFAGNFPGRTNTMPLEIFTASQMGDDARAMIYVGILTVLSFGVVLAASRFGPRMLAP